VKHRFELRLQVRRRLCFRSLCVHRPSTLPVVGCPIEWAGLAARPDLAPLPGRMSH
jgi:hypothetical protein